MDFPIEEVANNLIESYVTNMHYAWVPFLGAFVLLCVVAASLAIVWKNEEAPKRQKIMKTISVSLLGVFFIGLEILLGVFAQAGNITGANSLFILCSVCVCAGGIGALVSRVRGLLWIGQDDESKSSLIKVAKLAFEAVISLLCIGAVTLFCLMLLEMPSNPFFLEIPDEYLSYEVAIIAGVTAGLWFICQRRPLGLILSMALFFLYGIAEYFVETFKYSAIMPSDLRSANTGMSVAGGYSYELTSTLLLLLALFALAIGALCWLKDPLAFALAKREVEENSEDALAFEEEERQRRRASVAHIATNAAVAVLSVVVGISLIATPIIDALKVDWDEAGIEFNYWDTQGSVNEFGLIPSFIYSLQLENLDPPKGYSSEKAEALQTGMADLYDQYVGATPERQAASAQFAQAKPNVVLIMNESFADLSFLGGLGVGYEGPAYLNAMNAIAKGGTSVSVYGGGTCNSEFEALTGTSLGYVAGGINPYSVYDLSHLDSIPKQFKAMGYRTTAIHPEYASNWGRDYVYPAIGFDEFFDRLSFEGVEQVREHTSDAATYDKVLEQLRVSEAPQFVFDLTMMGHGGYDTGLIPEDESVHHDFSGVVDAESGAQTNEYLTSIRMSDEDIQEFLTKLERFEEPTVVVFFGDHQPGFSWWFKDAYADDSSEIAFQESMYQTDYFIWSNYDIAGSEWRAGAGAALYDGSMAPASLMSWTMSFIGAPLNDYEKADYVSRWWVQSNNVFGYLDAASSWHPMSESTALEEGDVYQQGMALIKQAMESGVPAAEASPEAPSAAVMADVMRWLAYLNFSALLK